eukprot:9180789-Karenia_brevis.AAC.1
MDTNQIQERSAIFTQEPIKGRNVQQLECKPDDWACMQYMPSRVTAQRAKFAEPHFRYQPNIVVDHLSTHLQQSCVHRGGIV